MKNFFNYQPPEQFCRFLKNGLVFNNDTTHFTMAPCCYFSTNIRLTPDQKMDRQAWLKNDFNVSCRACADLESSGLYSYRQSSFDLISGVTDQIEILTVAVNKICNLACPSCDAGSSSFWYQENRRHNVPQASYVHELHQEDRAGTVTEKFIQRLSELDLSQLKYVKFGGGEPLMSDTHQLIMDLIPYPEQVILHYTSNFTVMPSHKVFKAWSKFKLIKWVASIDGIENQFEYLRWPAQWTNIKQNIAQAKQTAPHNVMFGVEHTVNPLNVFYFDRFNAWFEQNLRTNRYGDPSDLNIHPCTGIMDLRHTPADLRDIIKQKYKATSTVIKLLDQHPWVGITKNMTQYLDQLDVLRNQDWRAVFPEVEKYFD